MRNLIEEDITIGELREALAYEDANKKISEWLLENGIEDEDEDDCDEWDEEDEEEDPYDYTNLAPQEEELAQSIADDINNGLYSLSDVNNMYSDEVILRIEELI